MKKTLPYLLLFLGFLLNTNELFAQVPVISYAGSPYTFNVGSAITTQSPTGGATVTGGYSSVSLLATSAANTHPIGITTDAAGNSYFIATKANGNPIVKIFRVTSAGVINTVTLNTNPLTKPSGIGIDGNGNLFVADAANGFIYKFTLNTGTNTATLVNTIGTSTAGNIDVPNNIAFDSSNNIYVADIQGGGAAAGVVFKINATTLAVSSYITGLNNPYGIAIDASSNTYISSLNTTTSIVKVTSGGVKSTISGFSTPMGLTSDGLGNIYVADNGSNSIKEISAAGVLSTMISNGLNGPEQVSFDGSRNLYEADFNTDQILKSTPTTFYTISAMLPGGLNFDPATGNISGTPTTVTASTNYVITGYNSSGNSATTITITVKPQLPAISYTTPDNFIVGTAVTLSPTNTGGAVVSYAAPSLPAGLTINTTTGVISGTPTAAAAATNYVVTATNTGGNYPFTINITINNPPPPSLSYAGNPYAFTAGVTNTTAAISNSGGTVTSTYTLNLLTGSLPAGITFSSTTGTFNCVPTVAGAATFTVTASDAGGSNTTPVTTITVNNPPLPVFTYTTPDTYQAGTVISPLNPNNTGGTPTSYAAVSLPAGLSISTSTGVITGTPTTASAAANYIINATNAAGTVPFTISITVLPKAPAITYTTPDVYTVGTAISNLTPNTSGGGTVVSYSVSPSLPSGLSIDPVTGIISGTPTAITASAIYTVTAVNTGGSGTFGINITVNAPVPVFTYTTPNVYITGTPITPTLLPSNTGGTPTSYSAVSLPAGLSINTTTGEISGTPTTITPATNYVIKASNTGGTSMFTINITVNPPPPAFIYSTPDTYVVGTAISPLSPTNTVVAPTTYSAPSLPAGLVINGSTGVITGTPSAVTIATDYLVTATNAGGSSSFTINITVNNPPLPVITYTTPDTYQVGTAITPLSPTSTGGAVVSYSATLPGGLAINTSTGVISGTPTTASAATNYTVTATNADGSSIFVISINVLPKAPGITYTTPDVYTVGTAIANLTPNTSGGGPVVSYTVSPALPSGLSIDPVTGIISGTPSAITASGTYTVTAVNSGGSGNFAINITVNAPVPVFTYTTPDVYTTGIAISPALTPANTGGTPTSYSAPSLPAGLSISTTTGVISGTPTAITPATNYIITAANTGGSSTFTINIKVNAPIPAFTYTTPDTYVVGTAISPTLTPSNTGGAPTSYSAPSLPAGLTINTGTGVISGTPATALAAANYVVTATNTGGSSNFTISITVNPKAPAISYPTPNTWLVGTAYSLSPTNTGGPAAGYTLSGTLAPGLGFNTTTGVISGTPTSALATTTYTITATNVTGAGTTNVVITVNQPAPVLSYTTPDVYTVGVPITALTPTNSNSAATIGYAVSPALPPGLGINTSTGVISGTPTAITGAANYTVTASTGSSSGNFVINITVNAPAPNISYSPSNNTYTVGTAISPLTPTNTGGAVPAAGFGAGTALTGTTFNAPQGMAFDASGNLYITQNNGKTKVFNSGGTYTGTFGQAQSMPVGIVFDSSGNAYILDQGAGVVYKYNSAGVLQTTLSPGGGFTTADAIAIDPSNNLYVADYGANRITKFATSGFQLATFTTNVNQPTGVQVDASGNVFVLNKGSKTITKYNASGIYVSTVVTGLSQPYGLGLDNDGNLYVGDYGSSKLIEYNASGTVLTTITGVTDAEGILVDKSGNLYVSDNLNNTVIKYPPAGGYYVNKTLPPGLSFDSTTGTFSGTPSAGFPATTFTVTCYNTGGPGSTTVTISCIVTPPNISYTPATNAYPVNQPIATLAPVNTGAPVSPLSFGTGVPFTGGTLGGPSGIGLDAAGNVYVTNFTNNTVSKYTASGSYIGLFGTGGPAKAAPVGMVFDAAGNAYVLNTSSTGNGSVYKYNSAGVYQSTIISGLSHPLGIAIDASGNFYVADEGTNSVYKYGPAGGAKIMTITSVSGANAVDVNVDAAGNIYVLNRTAGTVTKYNSSGTSLGNIISGLTLPFSIHIDGGGYVYIGNSNNNNVAVYTQTGTPITTFAVDDPEGLNIDGSGNLYVADYTDDLVYKYPPQGGYSINLPLPPGLSFSTATGAITGTPTVAFPATTYTVTAYGFGAQATTNVTISCFISYDWVGTINSDWNLTGNWESKIVPTNLNTASIGVNYAFTYPPVVSQTGPNLVTVGAIVLGNKGGQAAGVSVSYLYTLNVLGDITKQSDLKSTSGYISYLTGGGTVNATNINVFANTVISGSTYTEGITSSVVKLALTGNVVLTSAFSGNAFNAAFNLTSGTASVAGTVVTTNAAGSSSSFSVNPVSPATATLQLANASVLSTLSGTGTNTVSFNNSGATIEYSGAAQTVYTDAGITGLSSGVSYQNIKFSGTGAKTTNNGNLNVTGDFTNTLTNDASNYLALTAATVNFKGITQTLAGGAGTGTMFKNVTFSGAGTKTMASGMFAVSSSGILTMSGTSSSTILAANGNLTINSDINGCGTVAAINGPSITGNVNVQRYITGGAANYRGYRLLSSPVTAGSGIYSLNYVQNNLYLTGTTGTSGGFDGGPNPTLYLFRENLVPSNVTFISGNFRGVNNISTTPNYSIDGDGSGFQLPVGNGFLCFYRGDRKVAAYATETTPSYVPTADTLTATGTLNQGQIVFKDWYTSSSTNLGYTTISGTPTVEGFNLAGNPYASSIDWDTYNTTAISTGIYAPNTTGFVYVLDSKSKNYNVYQAGMGGAGTLASSGSNIIPSGQGFFVVAASASGQLVFNESAKVNTQATAAGGNLFLALQQKPKAEPDRYLHLELIKDSVNKDGIILSLSKTASANYSMNEDAAYKTGNGSVSLASRSADGIALAINATPYPAKAQPIPLTVGAAADGTYMFNMDELKHIPDVYDIWLKDAYGKDSLDIRHNPAYSFSILKSDTNSYGANRFSLVIRKDPSRNVHLLNFTANKIINAVKTVWTAENEEDYTNFALQKSTDGSSFATIDTLESSSLGTYSYTDEHPQTTNYYRLRMTDVAGSVTYSEIIAVMYGTAAKTGSGNSISIYPNPTNGVINVAVHQGTVATAGLNPAANTTAAASRTYDIRITNMTGEVLKTVTSASATWQNDVSSLLPGTYIIQVFSHGTGTVTGRSTFVKL